MLTLHGLLVLFLVLCLVGVILWGIGQIPGLPPIIKTIVTVLVCVALIVWALGYVGGPGLSLR